MEWTYEDIIRELIDVLEAMEGTGPLLSTQGQGMDSYSALANFVSIAKKAKKLRDG